MMDIEPYIRLLVRNLAPYSSARDEYHGKQGVFLDANENPHDFEYSRYPDPYQRELKSEIAKWREVENEQVFLGNGSDEVIDLLIKLTCERNEHRILSLDPSYGMYKVSSAINEIPIDLVAMDENLEVDEGSLFTTLSAQHRLVFICSPNNPNGGLIEPELIERLLGHVNGFVVIDEAYIDFSDSKSFSIKLRENKNLIILQTLSKSMGAAGLRLGIGLMNPYLVRMLNKIKPPYNISAPNQIIALARIKDIENVNDSIDKIIKERVKLETTLKAMNIVDRVFPSSANFLLVRFNNHSQVLSSFLDNKVIVRDRSSHTNCNDCIRISIGTKAENDSVIQILENLDI